MLFSFVACQFPSCISASFTRLARRDLGQPFYGWLMSPNHLRPFQWPFVVMNEVTSIQALQKGKAVETAYKRTRELTSRRTAGLNPLRASLVNEAGLSRVVGGRVNHEATPR